MTHVAHQDEQPASEALSVININITRARSST